MSYYKYSPLNKNDFWNPFLVQLTTDDSHIYIDTGLVFDAEKDVILVSVRTCNGGFVALASNKENLNKGLYEILLGRESIEIRYVNVDDKMVNIIWAIPCSLFR